ncbi:MAG: hypothetical protein AAB403_07660, partial [Planctomycetota bacterium]
MEEQNVQGSESAETKSDAGAANRKRRIIVWISGLLAVVVVAGVFVGVLIPRIADVEWVSNTMIAVYIAVGLAAAAAGAWLILRRTVRTRLRMQKVMKLDPDINDWLIIFNWTPKILYAPTIVASLAASVLMLLSEAGWWLFGSVPAVVIGGVWLAVFFLNFLIEEYSISVKVLLIILVSIGFFLLWL